MQFPATIQKATDLGAVGSEDYAKVGVVGRAKKNLARDFKYIATNRVDFPKHYIANIL